MRPEADPSLAQIILVSPITSDLVVIKTDLLTLEDAWDYLATPSVLVYKAHT
jgi:hypothetical protein